MNSPHQEQAGVPPVDLLAWLTGIVSRSLNVPRDALETDVPLTRYGMDSLAAIAILTSVADKTGIQLTEGAWFDRPTIASLVTYLEAHGESNPFSEQSGSRHESALKRMLNDSVLPADVEPQRAKTPAKRIRSVLLTGATGLLGIHLLRVLLQRTEATVYCLVRKQHDQTPLDRVYKVARQYGVEDIEGNERIQAIVGDVCLPWLGLGEEEYDALTRSVDAVYHSAADVNWGLGFDSLRDSNVSSVVDLLRFASTYRQKYFVFVSSISTCYAYQGPETVTESDSTLPLLGGIHLGYAQTKAVAESLLEQAQSRGLPVRIHRPALILGNSETGFSNIDDLVSRVIKGCILMGSAPDLNWSLDACPVDYVADAICTLSENMGTGPLVSHLIHPRPRHWRELVLWMNIYGYPMELVPYGEWVDRLRRDVRSEEQPLYALRSFFISRHAQAGGLTFPELYEDHRKSTVLADETQRVLTERAVQCPALDSKLLGRYFERFNASGYLPSPAHSRGADLADVNQVLNQDFFSAVGSAAFGRESVPCLRVERLETPADSSIIAELASWKSGSATGLYRYRLFDPKVGGKERALEIFVKVKPSDHAVLEVAVAVARLCGSDLGAAFSTFKSASGLAGCHKRELEVYRQNDPRFLRHSPRTYVIKDEDQHRRWIIAMEGINDACFADTDATAGQWPAEYISASIRAMAELHSIWYRREEVLAERPHLCSNLTAEMTEKALPLWRALAAHADGLLEEWVGSAMRSIRDEIIDDVGVWSREMEAMPRTLIHNDFNPRNILLRRDKGQLALCVFDWELATIGLPQRDLAEFLCFVLPSSPHQRETQGYVDLHRRELEIACGVAIDPEEWRRGFRLALNELILNRFPMYMMVHRVRPQRFLPRVVQTWKKLFDSFNVRADI